MKLDKKTLNSLLTLQKEILMDSANFVCKGGTLAYVTCSILKSENHHQIAQFLSQDSAFSLIVDKTFLPTEDGDGFYVSLLKRTS